MTDELRYAIDLPDPHDPEAPWVNYAYYETLVEAVEAARHHFGADDNGRIELISKLPPENPDQ